MSALPQQFIEWIRKMHIRPGRGGSADDVHQLLWILHRQGAQHQCVNDREDRRVGSDAQREREHSHGGEARVLQELAERKSEIVHTIGLATEAQRHRAGKRELLLRASVSPWQKFLFIS